MFSYPIDVCGVDWRVEGQRHVCDCPHHHVYAELRPVDRACSAAPGRRAPQGRHDGKRGSLLVHCATVPQPRGRTFSFTPYLSAKLMFSRRNCCHLLCRNWWADSWTHSATTLLLRRCRLSLRISFALWFSRTVRRCRHLCRPSTRRGKVSTLESCPASRVEMDSVVECCRSGSAALSFVE